MNTKVFRIGFFQLQLEKRVFVLRKTLDEDASLIINFYSVWKDTIVEVGILCRNSFTTSLVKVGVESLEPVFVFFDKDVRVGEYEFLVWPEKYIIYSKLDVSYKFGDATVYGLIFSDFSSALMFSLEMLFVVRKNFVPVCCYDE